MVKCFFSHFPETFFSNIVPTPGHVLTLREHGKDQGTGILLGTRKELGYGNAIMWYNRRCGVVFALGTIGDVICATVT